MQALQAFATAHPVVIAWLETIGWALLVAIIVLIAYRVAWMVASRLVRHRVFATTVLRFTRAAGRTVAILVVLQFVWDAAPRDLPRIVAVEHLTALALTIALAWLGMRCVGGVAEAILATHPLTATDNLAARRVQTQTRVVARTIMGAILFVGVALALMSFPAVRAIGTSLLASAGVAGLVVGLAARPALSNLIAGLQLALAQPIRLDDVVIIEGEWGRIEEIQSTYVVLRIWDERRLIVPLQWFLDHPFQNWTRASAEIIGTVFVWADYRLPVAPVAAELERLCREDKDWDRRVCVLQVTDTDARAMQLRALVSSTDSSRNWDLRCRIRAGLIAFIQERHPECLPQARVEIDRMPAPGAPRGDGQRRPDRAERAERAKGGPIG
jgi:small-conductance mechanosensitive channel